MKSYYKRHIFHRNKMEIGVGNGNTLQYSCLENWGTEELGSYYPWGRKESDTTERLHFPLFRLFFFRTSLVVQTVKSLSTMWETQVQSLGWKDPLEKEMAIHSSSLARKIPWTEEPGRLQSMESQSRTWQRDFTFNFFERPTHI